MFVLLIFYWFITTCISIGVDLEQLDELHFRNVIFSILFGWFVVPIKIGVILASLHKGK